MKIAIGCDPNAYKLKKIIIRNLISSGHIVKDFGSEDPVYANTAVNVAKSAVNGEFERGIVICGTGVGVSIAANKVPGAYCALATNAYQAERAALSNNANLIALGSQVTGEKLALLIVKTWLSNKYIPGGRSEPKIKRICDFEKEFNNGVYGIY